VAGRDNFPCGLSVFDDILGERRKEIMPLFHYPIHPSSCGSRLCVFVIEAAAAICCKVESCS